MKVLCQTEENRKTDVLCLRYPYRKRGDISPVLEQELKPNNIAISLIGTSKRGLHLLQSAEGLFTTTLFVVRLGLVLYCSSLRETNHELHYPTYLGFKWIDKMSCLGTTSPQTDHLTGTFAHAPQSSRSCILSWNIPVAVGVEWSCSQTRHRRCQDSGSSSSAIEDPP
ncbi:hypothetical protein TNCV_5123341 [Trichonephila clavipes]|nr:hypothetical protein TNCV_5123341 [Trichonephila clavipes]